MGSGAARGKGVVVARVLHCFNRFHLVILRKKKRSHVQLKITSFEISIHVKLAIRDIGTAHWIPFGRGPKYRLILRSRGAVVLRVLGVTLESFRVMRIPWGALTIDSNL